MAGWIDVKRIGSKSIGCWANNMTLTFDHTHGLDHGFSWSNFEIAMSQEREGIKQKGWESAIHDHDHDPLVTKVKYN